VLPEKNKESEAGDCDTGDQHGDRIAVKHVVDWICQLKDHGYLAPLQNVVEKIIIAFPSLIV
jgi:hypothetical protein